LGDRLFYLTREFKFDSAHNLIRYHGKCEKLHGHTYRLAVTIVGEKNDEDMIIDFSFVKKVVKRKILAKLDHSYINDIITQPTAENISQWIYGELKNELSGANYKLHEITLWETENNYVKYKEKNV
jgi:6-pyruvoyltetrahydropterin/6-carboxytetrahydropterin synthase